MMNQDRGSKAGASSSKMRAWAEGNGCRSSLYYFFRDMELCLWPTSIQFGALGGVTKLEDDGNKVRVTMTGFGSGSVMASETVSPAATASRQADRGFAR